MHNKITRIALDFTRKPLYVSKESIYPAIVINRGDYWSEPSRYRVTPMRLAWVQAVCSASGFVKDEGKNRAAWYHNIDPMYYGFKYESEFVTLEVLPDLRLKISINNDGREYLNEKLFSFSDFDVRLYFSGYKNTWDTISEEERETARNIYKEQMYVQAEYELLEDALCNGWTLDPDDDGRYFITYDGSIGDDGHLEVSAGDLGWSYNFYAIHCYSEILLDKGYVIFDPYYFGETSLEDQRVLSVADYE